MLSVSQLPLPNGASSPYKTMKCVFSQVLMPQGAVSRTSVRLGSRSDETSRCEGLLQGSCTENPSLVPLLNHSFEEVTDISKTSF